MRFKTIFALLLLVVMGCSKKEEVKDTSVCGCESSAIEQVALEGEIRYNDSTKGNYLPDTYWISVEKDFFIVCNESFLPNEVKKIKGTENTLRVKVAGNKKAVCYYPIAPAIPSDINYYNITLTKIELL